MSKDIFDTKTKIGKVPQLACMQAQKIINGEVEANSLNKAAAELHVLTCDVCIQSTAQDKKDVEI
ncbi:MAG: hypothetical protein ABIA11_01150 [Patescibacteria group bacterium]|nr:hypothetical protein [Patescibacteria group bacterium]